MDRHVWILFYIIIIGTIAACSSQDSAFPESGDTPTSAQIQIPTSTDVPTPTSTLAPPRVLSICGQEPSSLFIYGDTSSAARSILQAIYDGPIDLFNFQADPVILEDIPTLDNGNVSVKPVEVGPGVLIVDAEGQWASLTDGILYKPAGCNDSTCAETFEGIEPVMMDEMVIDFRLLPEILWSDGVPLTADDSVYSYQAFKYLFQNANPDILKFTKSYRALDDITVEWVGIPGYVGTIVPKFFSPLPEHILSGIGLENLLASEISTRTPLGWGPYVIDEWVAGDHITLSRNPNYFRSLEGLPHFDNLVYRFMQDGDEAIDALQIGECDFIDRTLLTEENIPRLETEQDQGLLNFSVQTGTAWELAAFGIDPIDASLIRKFDDVEVRQAIAMCIDRQKMVDELLFGVSYYSDTYVPLNHPLYNSEVSEIEFNPGNAGDLLDSIGWVDQDSDPSTPRTAQGVEGVPEGTPFEITYLVPSDGERPEAAQIVKEGLSACGIGVDVVVSEWDALMGSGPEGPLFGRKFEMTQFAWVASDEPSCNLFISDEIPGQYPDYPKGWGGANLTGYSNVEFDSSCWQARFSIPGSETYIQAHHEAQAIFANDLPVIPLYQRLRMVAMRTDLCNLVLDPASNSALSSLEMIDYGEKCE